MKVDYNKIPMPSKKKRDMAMEEDDMLLSDLEDVEQGPDSEMEMPEGGEEESGMDLSMASEEELMAELKKRKSMPA